MHLRVNVEQVSAHQDLFHFRKCPARRARERVSGNSGIGHHLGDAKTMLQSGFCFRLTHRNIDLEQIDVCDAHRLHS